MELTLKRLLEQAEFTRYKGKAYDPVEVDDFLDRASAMAAKVEVQLTQALARAKEAGGPTAEEVEAEAERRVAERLAAQPVAAPAGPSEEETAEEVRRTIVLAQRTADAAVREAREDAEKLRATAQERADGLLADAEARAKATVEEADREAAERRAEARARLAEEIGHLEGLRETLRSDVTLLELHVEEQRTQLSSTIAELQRLLEDPSGFRLAPAPVLQDPEIPDLTPEPVSVPEPVVVPEAEAPEAEVEASPLRFDEVDHDEPGVLDAGPPTAPVAVVDLDFGDAPEAPAPPAPAGQPDSDDAFLAELRKAIADDEPLGPRDRPVVAPGPAEATFDEGERRGWRFGRKS